MSELIEKLQGLSMPFGADVARLRSWLNAVLVLLLAYSMATLTWQLMVSAEGEEAGFIPTISAGSTQRSNGPGLDAVAALHLFGKAGAAPITDTSPIDAPETRLKFTLKGVFADSRRESAMAIIANGGKDEKSYRVGDVVAGAATLHQILDDRVILDRGGQLETLYLPKEFAKSGGGFGQPVVQRAPLASANNIQPRRSLDTGNVGKLRQQLMENPQDALQLINAQPVMENGQLSGFRVNPGKDRALFARVGLRPGDIVTAVNGMQLSDATQMGQVFQQLKSAQSLQVTINRGGREQQLQLKLD